MDTRCRRQRHHRTRHPQRQRFGNPQRCRTSSSYQSAIHKSSRKCHVAAHDISRSGICDQLLTGGRTGEGSARGTESDPEANAEIWVQVHVCRPDYRLSALRTYILTCRRVAGLVVELSPDEQSVWDRYPLTGQFRCFL